MSRGVTWRSMPWELWRQDDHGNEFLVQEYGGHDEAVAARDACIARGHHQHYWVTERAPAVAVRAPLETERSWLRETLATRWGGDELLGRGQVWRLGELDALIEAVAATARAAGARRLRVMTTNDNLRALRLYQRTGFRLEALRPGAVDAARERKPSIPLTGEDGIPVRDELDLVRVIAEAGPG